MPKKKGVCLQIILILSLSLTACSDGQPIGFYKPRENLKKIDSRSDQFTFDKEAPDESRLQDQMNKDVKPSYKLSGIEELEELKIVKKVEKERDKINIEFSIESMEDSGDNDPSKLKDYIWENVMFLLYTIVDTFPEVQKIRLYAGYHYINKYGQPYKEIVFVANVKRQAIIKINRDYFRKEMLEKMLDFYSADETLKLYTEQKKSNTSKGME
jgi:hypothetical protein